MPDSAFHGKLNISLRLSADEFGLVLLLYLGSCALWFSPSTDQSPSPCRHKTSRLPVIINRLYDVSMFSRSINSIGQTTTRFIASTRAIPARHIVHPPRPQPTYLLGVAGPSRSVHSTPSPYKRHITAPQAHIRKRPPRGLSNDPATLPPGYTIYPHHSDRLDTPPKMTHIHVSPHAAPPLPRCSIFDYLSPPEMKGKQPVYYPTPNSQGIAFIDGLTGESITRKELMEEARYLATGLRTLHVESGQVALLFGFNSLHYVKAILGCQALGVIVSPANAG